MCGICGAFGRGINDNTLISIVKTMSNTMIHRGPDGSGIFSKDAICLGHRRLSIIDLATGDQPMSSVDGQYTIVFNGEIYNYIEIREELQKLGCRFRTSSDTEVLLQAYIEWGEDCTKHFNGMWAFAIWDNNKKRLVLSRDRFGIKPLYYCMLPEMIIFASEPKALLATGRPKREINEAIIYDYLVNRITDHTSETFFNDIRQIPPGHTLLVKSNLEVVTLKYWQLPERDDRRICDESSSIAGFKELFSDSVKLRLRSDVPVGSCLSGGLDSTSIVCTASKMLAEGKRDAGSMHTFSAIFKGSAIDDSAFIRETEKKAEIVSHFTTPTKEQMLEEIEDYIMSQDEPVVGGPSAFAQRCVMKMANENRVKVLLDGQGADETLAGYTRFISSRAADLFNEGNVGESLRLLITSRRGLSERILTFGLFLSMAIKGRIGRLIDLSINSLQGMSRINPLDALDHNFRSRFSSRTFERYGMKAPFLDSSLRFSTERRLQELLRFEDRNSMRYSIETRLPFLDYRLVSYDFSIDDSLKVNNGWTKRVLREAMTGVIPERIRLRKDKLGFDVPESEWMRHILEKKGFKVFGDEPRVVSYGIISPHFLRNIHSLTESKKEWWKFTWRLFNLEMWLRLVVESNPEDVKKGTGV